jgi:hypothetical protein
MTERAGHMRAWEPAHRSVEVAVRTDISGVARVRTMPSEQEESALDSSLWQRARIII